MLDHEAVRGGDVFERSRERMGWREPVVDVTTTIPRRANASPISQWVSLDRMRKPPPWDIKNHRVGRGKDVLGRGLSWGWDVDIQQSITSATRLVRHIVGDINAVARRLRHRDQLAKLCQTLPAVVKDRPTQPHTQSFVESGGLFKAGWLWVVLPRL